jgi:hypothetical protein
MIATNTVTLGAQADEALRARRVRDYVMVQRTPGSGALLFTVDADSPSDVFHPFQPDQLFAVSSGRSVNLSLRFLNPLRYGWTVSLQTERDPLVASVEQFLASANMLFDAIGTPQAPAATARGADKAKPAALAPRADSGSSTQPNADTYLDPTLLEWAMWSGTVKLTDAPYKKAFESASAFAQTFDQLMSSRKPGVVTERITTAADFASETVTPLSQLLRAESISELKAAMAALRTGIARLTNANETARTTGQALRDAGAQLARLAADGGKPTRRDTVLLYSERALAAVEGRATHAIEAREQIVKQLGEMLAELDKRFGDTRTDDRSFRLCSMSIASGERTAVTLTVTERKVSISPAGISSSDLTTTTASFAVMERQSVVTEFTQGFAYTDVAYPQFRTNEDGAGHVVADAGTTRPRVLAIAMLNLIPNVGWSGFTRVVGQLGIGATTQSPLLLAGAGIRFNQPARFTLTAGAAFPFIQQLKSLSVGSRVAGEGDLTRDLERTLTRRPSIYIGIQR